MRRRRRLAPGQTRIDNSLLVRLSVSGIATALVIAVVALFIVRRWTDLTTGVLVTAAILAVLYAIFLSPEAMVISREEVSWESGWNRRGWRILRGEVAEVQWDSDPDLFEPPTLTFVDAEGRVLRSGAVEFDPAEVLETLRTHGWPLRDTHPEG